MIDAITGEEMSPEAWAARNARVFREAAWARYVDEGSHQTFVDYVHAFRRCDVAELAAAKRAMVGEGAK